LVNGAVFSDLNGDGWPDLVLACSWGPVRVFLNSHGRLAENTLALKLDGMRGWWNAVATGDFDEDGRPDIVAANWGANTPWQLYRTKQLRLYYSDADRNGSVQSIEAYFDAPSGSWRPIRGLDFLSIGMPQLREKFRTHAAFGEASIEDLWPDFSKVNYLEANRLESVVLFNRGDHFESRSLPIEAQFAPAFGTVVADFDGDGHEDIFLGQNFFAVRSDIPRMDAGQGLLLRGDGRGNFTPLPASKSGVEIYGEQRGAAAADFDGDGRVDLAVAQNGSELKVFRNIHAQQGRRVHLKGPRQNPEAIGAALRLYTGGGWGPLREIQAGSGYLSQNSSTQIFPKTQAAASLWIRWPGGQTNMVELPGDALDIEIDQGANVKSR